MAANKPPLGTGGKFQVYVQREQASFCYIIPKSTPSWLFRCVIVVVLVMVVVMVQAIFSFCHHGHNLKNEAFLTLAIPTSGKEYLTSTR